MNVRRVFARSAPLLLLWLAQEHLVAQSATPAGAAPGSQPPAFQTVIDREKAEPGDRIHFWVSVTNNTGAEMRNLRFLSLSHPDLDPFGSCWNKGLPACLHLNDEQAFRLSPYWNLKAGETVTFTATLQARQEAEEVSVSGLLGWQSADGKTKSSVLVPVGKVQIADWWQALHWLFEPIKDLALPLVLLYLGWRLRSVEQRRTQVQQTWSQMLQKSHENNERYYMPLSSAIFNFRIRERRRKAQEEKAGPPRHDDRLCDLLVILRRQRKLVREIGGWYFKTRSGENVIANTWKLFYLRANHWLGEDEWNQAVQLLPSEDNSVEVQRRLDREPALAGTQEALRKGLKGWWEAQEEFELAVTVLHMLEIVMDFEMNHPYEFWYGKRESFPKEDFDDIFKQMVRLQPSLKDGDREDLGKLLELLGNYRKLHGSRLERLRRAVEF
jgi:hypothetical protein